MMFDVVYETRYGDYKTPDVIKASSVLDIVQDIATKHSEACSYGMHRLKEMGIAWLMQGIKLHFNSPVKTGIPLSVHTAVKNMKGVVSERGTVIEQNGEVVAKVVASWFMFDTNKMRPCRIPSEIAEKYETQDFSDDFFNYTKPQLMELQAEYTITVRNKEIDTNNHLNNQKSAELLMDALPSDFFFSDMNVFYKKAAYLGDVLEVCISPIENGYYVHLQNSQKEICVAGCFTK